MKGNIHKMTSLCEWEVPDNFVGRTTDLRGRSINIATAISVHAGEIIRDQMPDMLDFFPFSNSFLFAAHFDSAGWFALRVIYLPHASICSGPKMEESDAIFLKERIEPYEERSYATLKELLGSSWYGKDRFTYVGSYSDNKVSWQDIVKHLIQWMNDIPLPSALEINRARILRVIPESPLYETANIAKSLWVLECEKTSYQGTAFALSDVGLVTCAHVIGEDTHAFRYDNPVEKFSVRVIKKHDVIDLAILSISRETVPLSLGTPSDVNQMDHILVAGHPNYRFGDSPFFMPGLIVGFRPVSGIRRFLTNAAIVSGNSGGPVLDRDGNVIGVAVTGANSFATQGQTEDHGIIPIDAINLI